MLSGYRAQGSCLGGRCKVWGCTDGLLGLGYISRQIKINDMGQAKAIKRTISISMTILCTAGQFF